MKKGKYGIGLMIFVMFVQKAALQSYGQVAGRYVFASGMPLSVENATDTALVLFLLFPIFFLLFLVSGRLGDLKEGYGKLLVIRNVSKRALYLKEIVKLWVIGGVFLLAQTVWYTLAPVGSGRSTKQEIAMILLQYACLMGILMLQMFLELYWDSTQTAVFLIVYMTVVVFLGGMFPKGFTHLPALILLFPNLLFGYRNGCLGGSGILQSIGIIAAVNIGCIILSLWKFQRSDIY